MYQGRREEAKSAFLDSIKSNSKFAPAYANMCFALAEEERFEKAVKYGKQGLAIDPTNLPLYSAIAYPLRSLGRLDEAIDYLRKALSLNNNDVQTLSNLGALLFENGQKDEAESTFLKALQLQPNHAGIHRMLSLVRKYKPDDEHIAQMKTLLPSLPENADIHFALGKAYEDTEKYQKSFEHYHTANTLYRRGFEYSIDQDITLFQQIKEAYTKDFIEKNKITEQTKAPIFIVGMPRSATSLVEQILASHPEVHGAGELNRLNHIQFNAIKLDWENYAASIEGLEANDFRKMAKLYLKKLESVWDGPLYVADKMPLNFRYLGLIKILFPKAKIIHCIRDPRDTCFSIFKTCFTGLVPFAYSQNEIVSYYKLYKELMAYWHSILPGEIFDIHYETLVKTPKSSIHALLQYCDLEWNDDCVQFHKNKRAVTTASALQVRKPIYKGAVGYWRKYEPYLEEITCSLQH